VLRTVQFPRHNGCIDKQLVRRGAAVPVSGERYVPETEIAWEQTSRRVHRWILPVRSSHPGIARRPRRDAFRHAGCGPHQRESIGAE